MSMNILNDISKVYMEQVAAKPDFLDLDKDGNKKEPMKKAAKEVEPPKERLKTDRNMFSIPKGEQEAARERLLAKARAKREKMKEQTEIEESKKRKVTRWWDNDGDGIGYEEGEVSGKFKRKKVKEGFSNWRQDLSEVMDEIEANKEIKEKKVNNKIKINPDMKETVEQLGGELVEMVELDEKMNMKKSEMGDVIKDFQKSDAPQFKGKTKEERRQMAIAAKLTAERGGKKLGEQQEGNDQEKERQQMLANKKKMLQKQGKLPLNYGEETALDRVRASIIAKHGKGMIHDPNAPKKPRTQKKRVDSRTKREKETQGRYLGGGRPAGD